MDNQLLAMLRLLTKKTYLSMKEVELETGATKRQITYRIEKVNSLLKKEKVPPVTVGAYKDIEVAEETREVLQRLLDNFSTESTYYLNKQERLIYMYLMLFLNLDYLSLNHFIDALQVSRSTVLLDFKDLVQELETYQIQVKNNRSSGYYLTGSEMEIRRYMMRQIIYTIAEKKNSRIFDLFIEELHLDNFEYSRQLIDELSGRYHIRFVENRLLEFIYIFIFLKARMQSGIDATEEIASQMDLEIMRSMKEHAFTTELLKHYRNSERILPADVNYISAWILGISFGDIDEDTRDCIIISDIIGKIMMRFETLSGIHYANTEGIFIQLYAHIRPAYYRLLFKLPIFNPISGKVREEYQELYQLVEEAMRPLTPIFGEEIPEEELAYLTMHFATIYAGGGKGDREAPKTALVVCSNGIGSSAILYSELTGLFPELHFLPPVEAGRVEEMEEHADIIFTTNHLGGQLKREIPVIKVSPVMTIQERYQVVREVYMQLGNTFSRQPNIDVIMSIVRKYADIRQENALYNELISYFAEVNMAGESGQGLHLSELVREELICLKLQARDWEEAVRLSCKPMVDYRYVTAAYVDAIIKDVRRVGPYIVITRHVALPHTKPEAGALRCAMGISTLEEPVEFGNQENDPVRYIFSLSATDNESHLRAMSELVEVLADEKFYELLDEAEKPEEILAYLKREEK